MVELTIPRLAGTREAARELLASSLPGTGAGGEAVTVVSRDVVSLSPSYADELVRQILQTANASELILISPPEQVLHRLAAAADRQGVGDRVRTATAASVPA